MMAKAHFLRANNETNQRSRVLRMFFSSTLQGLFLPSKVDRLLYRPTNSGAMPYTTDLQAIFDNYNSYCRTLVDRPMSSGDVIEINKEDGSEPTYYIVLGYGYKEIEFVYKQ